MRRHSGTGNRDVCRQALRAAADSD